LHESITVFFFFQAEDGIRDLTVTGVQTCALPISSPHRLSPSRPLRSRRPWCWRSSSGWRLPPTGGSAPRRPALPNTGPEVRAVDGGPGFKGRLDLPVLGYECVKHVAGDRPSHVFLRRRV